MLCKIVFTPVRAQSVDIYLDTVFCSLCCFHDAATRDCLKIELFIPDTSSQWFSSLSLLHLMPAVAELCCCFPLFVLSEAVFWLIVRRVTWLQRDLGLFCCSLSKCTMSCFSKSNRNSWSLASPSMAIFTGCIASYFCRDLAAKIPECQGAQWASATSLCLGWKAAPARTCCNCFHSCRHFKLTFRKLLSTEHLFYLKV